MRLLLVLLVVFVALACYYALRHPNGRVFPSRRDKLLRKVGPLATGRLDDVTVRFYTEAGGTRRVTLGASYRYDVKGESFTVTLPTDSGRLGGPAIGAAEVRRELERDFPQALVLEDGTRLGSPEAIRVHYLARLRELRPEVPVLYSAKRPGLSTVRDWP